MSDELARAALALARACSHGATLWCVSPGTPHHAQHLAVEFVHPVVVGARALPAVAVDDVRAWRNIAHPGDVAIVIGPHEVDTGDLLTIRLGHDVSELYDGTVVRTYHVLWELTQICLEHPGLLAA